MVAKKVYIEAYGCAANRADTESISGILRNSGFEIVGNEPESDMNLINTCIVKTPTEQRMRRRIQELSKTGKPLIVAGCMPKVLSRDIRKMNPNASLLGPNSVSRVVDAAIGAFNGKTFIFIGDDDSNFKFPKVRKNEKVGIVKISTGCLGTCSYCVTKLSRGDLRSREVKDILEEISVCLNDGCEVIHLTSEDNGCYGLDIGTNICELLEEVCKLNGDFKIKVGMMNPSHLNGSFLSNLANAFKHKQVKKFVHIPVQSGSNRVLKLMNRGYTVEEFKNIVDKFRKEIPGIYVSTDIIVGFPGETEGDFQLTIDLVKVMDFGNVNISRFGSRPYTKAASMEQLEENTIIERSKMLHNVISSS